MSPRFGVSLSCAALAIALLTGAAPAGDRPLLDAARSGDTEAVRALLAGGADPDVAQGDGLTPLHMAAQQGHVEITDLLIGAGAALEVRTRLGGYTPLHLASEAAHVAVVRRLMDAGAEVDAASTTSGVTPLHLAAKALHGERAVRALLEQHAPVDAVEKSAGQTALMFAAAYGRDASIAALLSYGADPAASTEVIEVLKRMAIDREAQGRLFEARTEARRRSEVGTAGALTATGVQEALAAQREYLRSDEVPELLADFDPDELAIRQPAWDTPAGFESELEILARPIIETLVGRTGGMTALLHAAREGHVTSVETLLEGGADIDQVSGDGSTALVLAVLNGQFDVAMLLIERGADPNLITNTDGVSALFGVLQTQWAFLFTDHPQPRAHESQRTQHMQLVDALLDTGADPNMPLETHIWHADFLRGKLGLDLTGATPFWRAAIAQDVDAMRVLAAHGADPHAPTTLPEIGMREGRQNDGRLQEDSGLPPLPEGAPNMYPIHAAAGGGYMGLGAFMMNSVPNNFLNAVTYLVEEHGADVNLPDGWGYTPLHYAAVRGGDDVIEYLVSKGADGRALSRLGQSAADMARGGRAGYFSRPPYPATVELLQSLGAPLVCLNTHFRGTGDFCPGAGVAPFESVERIGAARQPGR